MIEPNGIRSGDRQVMTELIAKRGSRVCSYLEELAPEGKSIAGTSVVFSEFQSKVVESLNDGRQIENPEALLLNCSRSVAADLAENPYRPLNRQTSPSRSAACDLMPQLLAGWLEATLTGDDEVRMARHFEKCVDCVAMRDAFSRAERRFRQGPLVELSGHDVATIVDQMPKVKGKADWVNSTPSPNRFERKPAVNYWAEQLTPQQLNGERVLPSAAQIELPPIPEPLSSWIGRSVDSQRPTLDSSLRRRSSELISTVDQLGPVPGSGGSFLPRKQLAGNYSSEPQEPVSVDQQRNAAEVDMQPALAEAKPSTQPAFLPADPLSPISLGYSIPSGVSTIPLEPQTDNSGSNPEQAEETQQIAAVAIEPVIVSEIEPVIVSEIEPAPSEPTAANQIVDPEPVATDPVQAQILQPHEIVWETVDLEAGSVIRTEPNDSVSQPPEAQTSDQPEVQQQVVEHPAVAVEDQLASANLQEDLAQQPVLPLPDPIVHLPDPVLPLPDPVTEPEERTQITADKDPLSLTPVTTEPEVSNDEQASVPVATSETTDVTSVMQQVQAPTPPAALAAVPDQLAVVQPSTDLEQPAIGSQVANRSAASQLAVPLIMLAIIGCLAFFAWQQSKKSDVPAAPNGTQNQFQTLPGVGNTK